MRNFFWLSFTGKNTRLLYFGFTMQTSSYSVVYLYYRASMLVILMKIPLSRICLLVSFSCSKIHAENCFFFWKNYDATMRDINRRASSYGVLYSKLFKCRPPHKYFSPIRDSKSNLRNINKRWGLLFEHLQYQQTL